MTHLLDLALRSLWNRRLTVGLTIVTLSVSVTLVVGVERFREAARTSFTQTVSGTDLIVGARTSPVQLLLHSVFHIGHATNQVSWQSHREIAAHDLVEWTIPISLGDSHRGYRVMGTTRDLFVHYRHARDRRLALAAGRPFDDIHEAVIGAEVAQALGYGVGRNIVISHGTARTSFVDHTDDPFTVTGVLERTGTPLDRTVLVTLAGIEAIHADWQHGTPPAPGRRLSADDTRRLELEPDAITAFLVGLRSRIATFRMQRAINEYPDEALTAVLPGVALAELWSVIGTVERALLAISLVVVAAALIGLVTTLLTGLNERRREMAILRAVGARPVHVFALFVLEGGVVGLLAASIGFAVVELTAWLAGDAIAHASGIHLSLARSGAGTAAVLGAVVLAAMIVSALPAWRAYRLSLADGLTVRL